MCAGNEESAKSENEMSGRNGIEGGCGQARNWRWKSGLER